ncbi:ABC transporter ATP-binding protein [Arthrobacter sp. I2-34]|uniref:ABC transporter ATP-binding protein n=1 Tax=Arthrobacter hankyongi TaxID=2904801 RepID=A0ABS9L8M0_9MICC|nr:ABC transporter ATP-binding protein [Arthrobacter hankyongi]MCG2623021.1 ABC transporter ATP-binding protein [Arthrobacter hankyongi]
MAQVMAERAATSRRPAGASIRIRNARKSYGTTTVLEHLDLDIEAGEFVTLLGPSGSGKSTLLNAIAGLENLTGGTIEVDGRDLTHVPAHRRGFGMVFQSYALFPHLTVAENVGYPLRIRHLNTRNRRARVEKYLQLVALDHVADRLPSQLSGGQQQRVSLARAMVFEPRVLLMDEPLGALDRNLRQALQFEIRKLQLEAGSTVIYVTHDHDEALSMSDKVALLNGGRIVQVAAPPELYRNPRNAYVAAAFGETSLLECTVLPGAGWLEAKLAHGGQALRLPATPDHTCTDGDGFLAVRPEMAAVTGPDDPHRHLLGSLTAVAFMGGIWRCEVRIGDETLIATAPSGRALGYRPGQEIGLTLDLDSLRLVAA